jgi:hypothetical protein
MTVQRTPRAGHRAHSRVDHRGRQGEDHRRGQSQDDRRPAGQAGQRSVQIPPGFLRGQLRRQQHRHARRGEKLNAAKIEDDRPAT